MRVRSGTTITEQLLEVLEVTGDDPQSLQCFYQPMKGPYMDYEDNLHYADDGPAPISCTFNDLPKREFDCGYGVVEGEPTICFSPRYVYVRVQYDGAEWFAYIPRNPDMVEAPIPIIGGG